MYNLMSDKCALGKFQIAVGSTTSIDSRYIVDDNKISVYSSNNSDYSDNDEDGFIINDMFEKS